MTRWTRWWTFGIHKSRKFLDRSRNY